VELIETVNSNILNNRFAYSQYSIELYKSSNNTISGNDISNITRKIYFWEGSGIDLSGSNGNRIFGNNITGYEYSCISLWGSSGNSIYANNLEKRGISLHDSQLNSMVGNNLSNEAGFFFWNSSGNSIIGNTVTSISVLARGGYAVQLNFHSSGNRIYHNNFVNDTGPVEDPDGQNFWDDGYPSGGNYWSDYNGSDSNKDGVGDEPYLARVPYPYGPPYEYVMNYPLMGMFYGFNTSLGCEVSVVSNSTIKDFEYFQSNSTIKMHVCNMTTNQEFGFVRICIPHTFMNETYHVTVDGAEPHYINYTLYDNGTHRWIYFSYQHSTLEIVIIPEFPSFLILPLFILTTLIATILLKKNRKLKFQQLS
jgi:parallel beta-helix repeat protein